MSGKMVKLQLGAIKSATNTSAKKPEKKTPVPAPTDKAPAVAVQRNMPTAKKIAAPQKPGAAPKTAVKQHGGDTKDLPQTSKPKLSLESIKAVDKKAEAKKQAEKKKQAALEANKEPEIFPIGASCELKNIELFPAYTSKFKRKQGGLLQKIKELKRLPKTNKLFISVLIGSTVLGIGMLFMLAPEKHNLNYYKTSLLENYHHVKENGLFSKKDPVVIPKPIVIPDDIEPDINLTGSGDIETNEETISNSGSEDLGGIDENDVAEFISTYSGSVRGTDETDIQYYTRIKYQILNK